MGAEDGHVVTLRQLCHERVVRTDALASRNVWLPGIGHMVTYEAPQAIVDAVVEQM